MATTTLAARPAPLVTALAGLVTLGIAIGPGRFGFTPILPTKRQDAAVSVVVGGWLVPAPAERPKNAWREFPLEPQTHRFPAS